MKLYTEWIFPRLNRLLADSRELRQLRAEVAGSARGRVLEVGSGPGGNFRHYAPDRVSELLALEPSAGMNRLAREEAAGTRLPVRFLAASADALPLADASVDTVVSTFTLCTLRDPDAALAEARRVLRPEGHFLFLEHGEAPEESVRRWQRRLNPVQRVVALGCTLDRPIDALVARTGFRLDELERFYGRGLRLIASFYRGSAVP